MKTKFNIRREVRAGAVLMITFGLIAFTERMKGDVVVGDIQVSIENVHDNHYLDENDVLALMQLNQENIKGASLSKVSFKAIERRIKKDPFIRDAELYSDIKGNIIVNVELRRPIARIVRNDGPDGYIAEDGTVMPVSDKFTSRVVLVSGAFVNVLLRQQNITALEEGRQLMELINAIRADEFWNSQIAQLDIDAKAKIGLLTQIGDENIEFGKAEDLEVKFKKLKIFYKEILPRVGWNKYKRVNVEYEGQIVAE